MHSLLRLQRVCMQSLEWSSGNLLGMFTACPKMKLHPATLTTSLPSQHTSRNIQQPVGQGPAINAPIICTSHRIVCLRCLSNLQKPFGIHADEKQPSYAADYAADYASSWATKRDLSNNIN